MTWLYNHELSYLYVRGVAVKENSYIKENSHIRSVDISGNKNISDIGGYANIMGLIEESPSHTKSTANQLDTT